MEGEPIKVTAVFLARAGEVVGKHIVELQLPKDARLKDLIKAIGEKVSRRFADGVLSGKLIFLTIVDGNPVYDLNTKLKNGSRVVFTTPEMGG